MRELFLRNMSLKLLSLFFAVSLWMFVNLKATTERTLNIPVKWENLPNFLVITNTVNDSVRVQASGPRRIISSLKPEKSPVILDLSAAKVGLSDYQINEKMIQFPPGVTATVLPPDTIQFKIELIGSKEVPVKPQILGKPPKGYTLDNIEVSPGSVEIVGPQSEMLGIYSLQTEPLSIKEMKADFEKKVDVIINQPHVWLSKEQKPVLIRGFISEGNLKRMFLKVPVILQRPVTRSLLKVAPPVVNVLVSGPAGIVSSLEPGQILATAALPAGVTPFSRVPVSIQLTGNGLEGLETKSIPAEVEILVQPIKEKESNHKKSAGKD